ncbi:MAG: PQQ-like beta-propeller repeat protein [Bacteroidales bacterium]|nr:PQQ-like beta-propeller repeat protein [Bacteroidales bacterium]
MRIILVFFAVFLFVVCHSQEAQWRGPYRSGVFPDTGLLKTWPVNGPAISFQASGIGRGYSSAVATERHIFVTGMIDSLDMLSCLDLNGNIDWQRSFGRSWDQSIPDSRCTPLVDDGKVYVLSGKDNLVCFEAVTGDILWNVDIHERFKSHWDMFGVSESLLMVDDKIIVTPGGSETTVIALDKLTGQTAWKSEPLGTERSNGSPVLLEDDSLGLRQVIAMNRTHVMGVDTETGEIKWTHHYHHLSDKGENVTILANSPLTLGNEIFISDGWDVPSVMLEVSEDGNSVTEKYDCVTLDNQNHGLIKLEDFVYGSNFLTRNFGKWVCMRWETGEIMWVEEWENKGPVISADGMLYMIDEKGGNMALAHADENGLDIISSFKIKGGRGPFWARPSIYNGMLLVRHGDVLIAYNLKN